jgi:hypothetical protein
VKREQAKILDRESQLEAEGSFWELCIFAVFFVVVFTALASSANALATKTAQSNQSKSTFAHPIHMATQPSATSSPALPSANMSAGLPIPDSNKRIAWTSSVTLDTSGTLNNQEATSYSGEYLLKTGLTDQKKDISATLKAGYSREYSFEQADGTDGDFVDPSLAIKKTWTEGKQFRSPVFDTIFAVVSTNAGASHESARRTFTASLGPSLGVTKVIHKLHLGQKFGYQRKFYNYDIRDDGTVNAPDQGSSTTDISYDITPDLAISAETILYYAINYQGTGETTEWSSFSLDYTISKLLSTSIGVATKRGTSSDDGTYNSVKFVDGTVAQGFLDLILSF